MSLIPCDITRDVKLIAWHAVLGHIVRPGSSVTRTDIFLLDVLSQIHVHTSGSTPVFFFHVQILKLQHAFLPKQKSQAEVAKYVLWLT